MPELFEELHIENFLSYRSARLQLANRGLVLLAGPNGNGKSAALPDALLFAAFGKTLRGVSGPRLVNRQAGRDGLVTLTGFDQHGAHYALERPLKHRKKPKSTLTVGSDKYTGDADVERVFRLIIGDCGYDALVAAMIYGKGDSRFFTQLTDARRKQILDELMGFRDLNRFLDVAKTSVERFEAEALTHAHALQVLLARRTELEAQEAQLEEAAAHFEQHRQQELQVCGALLARDRIQLGGKQAAITKLEAALPASETLLRDVVKEQQAAAVAVETLRTAWAEQDKQHAVLAEKRRGDQQFFQRQQDRIQKIQALSGAKCPTCFQDVNSDFSAQCGAAFSIEAREFAKGVAALEQQMVDVKKRCEALDADVATARAANAAKQKTVQEVREVVTIAKDALTERRRDLREVTDRIARTEAEAEKIRARTNDAQTAKAAVDEKIATLLLEDATLTARIAEGVQQKLYHDFWVKGFGNAGIKSLLLDGVAPRLNDAAAEYSQILTDGTMRVGFSPNRVLADGRLKEEFDVQVEIENAAPSYDLASDGQRRRADIISMFALGDIAATRVGSRLNLMILDEITDGLDATGIERVIRLLHYMTSKRSSIFCITHDETLASVFPAVLQVTRDGGFSHVG